MEVEKESNKNEKVIQQDANPVEPEKDTSVSTVTGDNVPMENPESTLDLETSLQLKVSRLEKEVEDQKRTIAELTGTDSVHIDTNDVTVLYHLQLRENQSLRAEIERLQQLLSEKKGQEAAFETIHTDVLNPLHSIVEGTEECHNLISILVLILCVAHE